MQTNKMTKKLMIILFTNLNLIFMQEYLSYKNVNKIRILLTKLPYNKVI